MYDCLGAQNERSQIANSSKDLSTYYSNFEIRVGVIEIVFLDQYT